MVPTRYQNLKQNLTPEVLTNQFSPSSSALSRHGIDKGDPVWKERRNPLVIGREKKGVKSVSTNKASISMIEN